MRALRAHAAYDAAKFEVFVDGGVRRGTDVFKARSRMGGGGGHTDVVFEARRPERD